MGSRSRIRWHKVTKVSLGVFGCLALFGGLPSLIRRPEPPPLEPDVGLAPAAAFQEPASSGRRPVRHKRRAANARGRPSGRAEGQRRLVPARRPTHGEGSPTSTGSPDPASVAPAPAPIPVPTAGTDPPPAPPPPMPAAPPPARPAAPQPSAPSEFGFER